MDDETDYLESKRPDWMPEEWHVIQIQYRRIGIRTLCLGYVGQSTYLGDTTQYFYKLHPKGKWHPTNGYDTGVRKILIRRGLSGQTTRIIPVPWQWHTTWI